MKKTKPTPGPWKVGGWSDNMRELGYRGHRIHVGKGSDLAVVYEGRPESEANASLMSASPELLAVLKKVVRIVRLGPDNPRIQASVVAEMIAAIAKAEGTNNTCRMCGEAVFRMDLCKAHFYDLDAADKDVDSD